MGKKKSKLQRQLEESLRLAKLRQLPVQKDALGRRLEEMDRTGPTALDDPDTLPERPIRRFQ